jgi:hypothetical protein
VKGVIYMKEVKSLIFGIGAVVMAMVLGASLLTNVALATAMSDKDKKQEDNDHDD